MTRVLRYVPHHAAPAYLALGWLASPALEGTHHGADSVLMVWLCACPVAAPRRAANSLKSSSGHSGNGSTEHRAKNDLNDFFCENGTDVVRDVFDREISKYGAAARVPEQHSESRRAAKRNSAAIATALAGLKTATALQTMTFAPLKYIVPGLMVEGCVLLAGKPKAGKSWFALDVALAVASGRYCLGDRKCEQGDVLVLALEDNDRRMQSRATKLLPTSSGEWPERFAFQTKWPRAGEGGIEAIDEWCEVHPNARLVVIDVLAKFRTPSTKQNAYEQDYAAVSGLQQLAARRGITILIIHHTRKGDSEDPVEEISGTLGLGGGVDAFLILKRKGMNGTLIGRGRDTEDQDLALQFSKETCRWTILGQAADVRRTEHKGRVLVALEEAGGTGLSPKEISDEVDELSHGNARQLLRRMAQAREVQADRGRYFHNSVSLSKTLVTLSPGPVTAEGVCKKPGNQPCSLEETGDSDTVTAFTDNVTSAHTPAPAVDFLLWALKPGQRLVRDIEASARAEGLLGERQRIDNAKAFRQAKQVLQLVVEREGFGPGSKVYWRLPDDVVSTDTTSEPEAGDQ